jgi:hypothetical protein
MKNCEKHFNVEAPGCCPICLVEEHNKLKHDAEIMMRKIDKIRIYFNIFVRPTSLVNLKVQQILSGR